MSYASSDPDTEPFRSCQLADSKPSNSSSSYAIASNDTVVTLAEQGAYADIQKALDLSYTDERSDYPFGIAFANFRGLSGGKLKPGMFFRGAAPVYAARTALVIGDRIAIT